LFVRYHKCPRGCAFACQSMRDVESRAHRVEELDARKVERGFDLSGV
jgi:hypothetical protein